MNRLREDIELAMALRKKMEQWLLHTHSTLAKQIVTNTKNTENKTQSIKAFAK